MLERILFNVIALGLFLFLFFRMIQKNDTNYIYILALQALGIAIGFFALIINVKIPIIVLILTYIFSIILPIIIILIERKGITLTEVIYISIYKMYSKLGLEDKAKNIILKLVEKDKYSFYGHKLLAEVYEKEGNLEIATEEYIRASNIKPNEDKIQYKIAELFNKTGKQNGAVKILQELLRKKPEWQEATLLLGDIFQEQERFKEAVNVYLDAIQYHPENYDLYYNLGMVYTMLNDFQSAKEYYEKAAELNSLLYNAKYNLGQIALLYNELEEAENYFIEDEELEDDAYFYLAYIAMLKGDEVKAIDYLNVAVGENPEIYDRIKKELIFKIILYKVDKPSNNRPPKKKNVKITKKEKQTITHLRHTYEVVGNLNHNDIKVMKIIQTKRDEEKERE